MARKSKRVSISFSDGSTREFDVTQVKVRDGHAILERLARVVGPSIGSLVEAIGEKDPTKQVGFGDLGRAGVDDALERFAKNLGEGDLEWLSAKLRTGIKLVGEDGTTAVPLNDALVDEIFAGEYFAFFRLLGHGLEVNFGSFFEGAGGLAKLARQATGASRSSSRTTAMSGSGDSS